MGLAEALEEISDELIANRKMIYAIALAFGDVLPKDKFKELSDKIRMLSKGQDGGKE